MSNVYFISDLHLGHKNIVKFEPDRLGTGAFNTVDEHDHILETRWNMTVNKRDLVFVLGDVAFTADKLKWFGEVFHGRKILVRGNHDIFDENLYRLIFEKIYGLFRYKDCWLSHAPIHPQELRGKYNVHGHVHSQSIPDTRYINCCVEMNQGYPQRFDKLIRRNNT